MTRRSSFCMRNSARRRSKHSGVHRRSRPRSSGSSSCTMRDSMTAWAATCWASTSCATGNSSSPGRASDPSWAERSTRSSCSSGAAPWSLPTCRRRRSLPRCPPARCRRRARRGRSRSHRRRCSRSQMLARCWIISGSELAVARGVLELRAWNYKEREILCARRTLEYGYLWKEYQPLTAIMLA